MNRNYDDLPNGYLETIQRGVAEVRRLDGGFSRGVGSREERLGRLNQALEIADALVIGAGAGLSTAAGFVYTGERFDRYFGDFGRKYGFRDMYSGGFAPFETQEETWAYWSRYIWINRYAPIPSDLYERLLALVRDKDYFVLTTNVDHCFQRTGFAKERVFYTQGDFGLWQCSEPCHAMTYDNEDTVRRMVEAQGFLIAGDGTLEVPAGAVVKTSVPSALIPYCPVCGKPMVMNLRADDKFVEDEGWNRASAAYSDFLRRHAGQHILFLEIGVGGNTPVIIKYPFWQMTIDNPNAVYACLNYKEAFCPKKIEQRSVCIDGDAGELIAQMLHVRKSCHEN